jgi:ATP-dependent helicase HrpA
MTREYLMRQNAAGATQAQFPDQMDVDGVQLKLRYRFEPAHPLDGVTVTVPLHLLNKLEETPFDWLVPGMLRDKATWGIKALPKNIRRHLFPLPEQVSAFLQWVDTNEARGSFEEALRKFVQRRIGEPVPANAWDDKALPAHLRMNFRVVDEGGRELGVGRDLLALKGQLGQAAQLTFGQTEAGIERSGLRAWDFGDLLEEIAFARGGRKLTGYPGLVDEGDSVAIRLFDLKQAAEEATRAGVRRLLRIALKGEMRKLEKAPPGFLQPALQLRNVANAEDLREDLIDAVSDRAFIGDDDLPRTPKGFEAQRARARTRLPAVTEAAIRLFTAIADEYQRVFARLSSIKGPLARPASDIRGQLSRLVYKGFFTATPWDRLADLPRYLKAMQVRLDKYGNSAERDEKHTQSIAELTKRYEERLEKQRKAGAVDPRLEEFRWHLEELRVSLFAQELKTPYPVSYKRLEKIWNLMR